MWCDIWSDAQTEKVHPPVESPKTQETGFSGQDHYYDYLDFESEIDPNLIQEEKLPNPVYPDSIGPDDEMSPAWVKEDLVKEVEGLKNKLFAVENKLAKLGGTEKWPEKAVDFDDKKLMAEIKSLREKIEKVSSQIGIENEISPWEVKRD